MRLPVLRVRRVLLLAVAEATAVGILILLGAPDTLTVLDAGITRDTVPAVVLLGLQVTLAAAVVAPSALLRLASTVPCRPRPSIPTVFPATLPMLPF